MTPPIERIRYYDGEYLRAFDFAAEQGYHNDMRRRLNLALHLYGIVEGLQLTASPDAGISQVSINPGMAIDPYGREIFLLAPYTFDDTADVLANQITRKGPYQVWIKYSRVADTPPSVGYGSCNGNGQSTRWRETSRIVLLQNSSPPTPPAVTDDISEEDPDTDTSLGVFLGVVSVTPNSLTGVFDLPSPQPSQPVPVYIGLNAQRIQPPDFPDTVSPPFDITSSADSLSPPLGVEVESNLFVDQNLIVGDNFDLTLPSGVTTQAAGNVKVAADEFLQGELYTYRLMNNPPTPAWVSLGAYIKSFLPDIKTGTQTIVIPNGTHADPSQGTFTPLIPVTTSLTQLDPSKVVVFASISAVAFTPGLTATQYQSATYAITASATPAAASTTTVNLSLGWTVGPSVPTAGNYFAPIFSITVTWLVIFYPL